MTWINRSQRGQNKLWIEDGADKNGIDHLDESKGPCLIA